MYQLPVLLRGRHTVKHLSSAQTLTKTKRPGLTPSPDTDSCVTLGKLQKLSVLTCLLYKVGLFRVSVTKLQGFTA